MPSTAKNAGANARATARRRNPRKTAPGNRQATQKTRIRAVNEEKITQAATVAFARHGYRGATLAQIAGQAGMSKPNLLYYFRSKQALYQHVLRHIYDIWMEPLRGLDVNRDPAAELEHYIDQKVEHSRRYPLASKVWANEIISGGALLKPVLDNDLRETVKRKSRVLRTWMRQGKIAEFDAPHFLYTVWATTQHYADFDAQIKAVSGKTIDNRAFYAQVKKNLKKILLHGVLK